MSGDQTWREAYDRLDYEMVEQHENLTVPVSQPAFFEYETAPAVTNADVIRSRLNEAGMAFIDEMAHNGDGWYEFHYSAKVYHDNNEFLSLEITTAGVSILRNKDPLSYETFADVVDLIGDVLKADLRLTEASEDD